MGKFKELYVEDIFTINELDMDRAYEIFSNEYKQATGYSWDKDKFLKRAENWEFYGDGDGFVAVRPQASGYYKLVGVAGSPKSKLKGFNELVNANLPVWGMVSDDMVGMAKKKGFIVPPAWLIKVMIKRIPSSVFGGADFEVNKDGSVTFKYSDVGEARKYFIGSKQYFKKLLGNNMESLPKSLILPIKKLLS